MLRGYSRHDGIPNQQSARERDRDRQRERQRQERAQMLPNDDKDISTSAQDLFQAPVKVDPSVEDRTTVEIRNTLGNFESVKHYVVDNSSGRSLIGVDQNSNPSSASSRSSSSGRPSALPTTAQQQQQAQSGVKNPPPISSNRNFPPSATNNNNNNNSGGGVGGTCSQSNNSSKSSSSSSNNNNNKVPHSQNLPPYSTSQSSGNNNNIINSGSSSIIITSAPNNNNINNNNSNSNPPHGQQANSVKSKSGVYNSNNNSSNAFVNNSGGSVVVVDSSAVPSVLKVDKNSSNSNNLNNNNVNNNSAYTSVDTLSAENPNDKHERSYPSRKTALLDRADSLDLDNILKEMMDVTAPITAIQTPVKESPVKKYTPRRASQSEEKIVDTIREGMTNIPSPLTRMESSESSSTDTDSGSGSDSEESSSGSQGGQETQETNISKPVPTTNSPTRWNLQSFMKNKDNVKGTPDSSGAPSNAKSPKDGGKISRDPHASSLDSEESPGELLANKLDNVTSTSIFKSMSSSPVESASSSMKFSTRSSKNPHASHPEANEGSYSKVPGKSPRKTAASALLDSKGDPSAFLASSSSKQQQPAKNTIPSKGPASSIGGAVGGKISSLSASSSDDDDEEEEEQIIVAKPVKEPAKEKKKNNSSSNSKWKNKQQKRSSSSSSERQGNKSDDDDSGPETDNNKKKVVQDKNKGKTIMKVFMHQKQKEKIGSPSVGDSEGGSKGEGGGTGRGKGGKASNSTNRVSAKDGRKASAALLLHNGDMGEGVKAKGTSGSGGGSGPKKSRESALKDSSSTTATTSTTHTSHHHGSSSRKHKSYSNTSGASTTTSCATPNKFSNNNNSEGVSNVMSSAVINPAAVVASTRTKDEPGAGGKLHPSSLMCRIPLAILPRPPVVPPAIAAAPASSSSSAVVKSEKELLAEKVVGSVGNSDSSSSSAYRVKLHYDPGRVGSSSDHAAATTPHDPQRDDPMCSDSERTAISSRKRPKKKPRSPKKNSRIKLEPDSYSKIEEESGEVSSNVWTPCDSISVSTTRTPPVELDIAPAPDSSLNPPHLPSPVVPQQPIYFSYFERNNDAHEDYYTRDQDSYLEEAKRLKHKADGEKLSTTQASTYLEAGLYFILTGLSMERDRQVGSQSAFTMYKDTLSLIRYIGTRFRSSRNDYTNAMEAKIMVLSMRCQSLLSLKLFKIKMRETKEIMQYLQDHFQKAPPDAPIPNSPQLSTPSPHSPTSSPAGSSGILQIHTPSPHPHPNQNVTTVPRNIYSQMYKHCNNAMNLINAHEWWESADNLVEKYHMEDFFVAIDRQYGPLTMHNSLVDLVRYVKHGLKTLKMCSDIS